MQVDLEKKMKVYDKSLLIMHSLGRQVCPDKVREAMARVVAIEPGWPARLQALAARLL